MFGVDGRRRSGKGKEKGGGWISYDHLVWDGNGLGRTKSASMRLRSNRRSNVIKR